MKRSEREKMSWSDFVSVCGGSEGEPEVKTPPELLEQCGILNAALNMC